MRILIGALALVIGASSSAAPLKGAGQAWIKAHLSQSYFQLRQDPRLCVAPLCGGFWVSAVNKRLTRCADGSLSLECYVAEVDWRHIGLSAPQGVNLVLASLSLKSYPGFPDQGVLVAEGAWRSATDKVPEGTWYRLGDTGLQCVTAPCYSLKEKRLNRPGKQRISGVDLSGAEAGDEDLYAAQSALSERQLIAVGANRLVPNEGPGGDGLRLAASQFYLPVPAGVEQGTYCEVDSDCTSSPYDSYVVSREQCYCPLCPVPMNDQAAQRNEESWRRHCAGFGYASVNAPPLMACPRPLCILPNPVGCVSNQCTELGPVPLELH